MRSQLMCTCSLGSVGVAAHASTSSSLAVVRIPTNRILTDQLLTDQIPMDQIPTDQVLTDQILMD